MGKQASVVRGAGSSSGQKRKGADDEEDDDPRWLSLGSIYSSAAAAAASASPTLAGDSRTPLTPSLPVPQYSVDVLGTPSAAATHRPPVPAGNASAPAFAPGFATSVLIGSGSGAFLATSVLTPAPLASSLPSLFPGDGNGAVPVPIAEDGNTAVQVVPVPGSGNTSPPTQLGPLPIPLPCIRLSTTLPAKEGAAPRPFVLNSQLQCQHSALARPSQRSTRRRTCASSNGSGRSSNGARAASSNGDPAANNGASEARDNGGLLQNPPFPWATNRLAVHHSFTELSKRGITTIEGESECRRCETRKVMAYNIESKFKELADFILCNFHDMDDRAPARWMNPTLPDCDNCSQKNSLRPLIPTEKEKINWMFLLLGQTLGLCTLDQLKHFCAHTKQHRTGAKDRVLYSTYMELCNQLFPDGPFDVTSERQNRSLRYA